MIYLGSFGAPGTVRRCEGEDFHFHFHSELQKKSYHLSEAVWEVGGMTANCAKVFQALSTKLPLHALCGDIEL